MSKSTPFALLLCLTASLVLAETPEIVPGPYKHGPDSERQEGVPRGTTTQHQFLQSDVFPGTKRHYSIYVPAQYDGKMPAALMVFQDGHAYQGDKGDYRVATVFDNLIHKKEMPVTIAVMIDPGYKSELPEKRGWNPKPENRSFEYDSVSDDYARFLLEEILPVVSKDYKITENPELRAICGMSSGGICAFGVAWHRPDSFRKVMSQIGSFTDIRGGYVYAPWVRKESKPIRVFLQDGANDLNNKFGSWPLANQTLANSLDYAKYDYKFVYGDGEHNGYHGGTIFPDALRWLWRGWEEQTP
jgi:enterochelin esterase-like enzyme